MVGNAGVIEAVQIGHVQHLVAFIAKHIHVIFQQDRVTGEGACFIHTKHIHAAKSLHGVDVLDDCLFAAHGCAAFRQAGVDDHRQHFRCQPYSH